MTGLIVLDSLGSFRSSSGRVSTAYWIDHTLSQYGLDTEVHFVDGASFSGSLRFREVLRHETSRQQYAWILLISAGNDVYRSKPDKRMYEAIVECMNVALLSAPKVLVVFGGSSRIWRYKGHWAYEYNRRLEVVLQSVLPPNGASIITGADELVLEVTDVVDRIGHVRFGIGAMRVIEAIKKWADSLSMPRAKL